MKSLFLLACAATFGCAVAKYTEKMVLIPNKDFLPIKVKLAEYEMQTQPFYNADSEVTFELYTLKNPTKAQILSPDNITSITESNLNPKVPTRVSIHGWQERGDMKRVFLDAYFQKAKLDVNLIVVNWERYSHTLNYIQARNSVEDTGIRVATLLDAIIDNTDVKLDDINVIGFSLGAHIAGHTGKQMRSGKLAKITGLDPAGPLFDMDKPEARLDKNDAKYVEIIHTNGAFLGMKEPIGTTSFYPNSGMNQSGCGINPIGFICSHLRSYQYFAESLYSKVTFYGYPCSSYSDAMKGNCAGVGIRMGGEPGNYKAFARFYYLSTNPNPIFARGGSRDM